MYRGLLIRCASRLPPCCRPSPIATAQLGLQLRSVSSTPFVWPRTSDPPAGVLNAQTQLFCDIECICIWVCRPCCIYAHTLHMHTCLCSCQENSREERFKATLGSTQGDERQIFEHGKLSLILLPTFCNSQPCNMHEDAFHHPKRPNGEDRSRGLL